jgi:tetratricopeptide (TPR) repeat protein
LTADENPKVELTPAQRDEHDRLFGDAIKLAKPYILLRHKWHNDFPDIEVRTKLGEALELFKRVLAIDPLNWGAMGYVGKIYQRLWNYEVALEWFQEAARLNPSLVDLAQEASLTAQYAGKTEEGIRFARQAVSLRPDDIALHNSLAIALLLADRLTDAKHEIAIAIAQAPLNRLARQIESTVDYFIEHGATPPATRMAFVEFLEHRPF